MNHNFVNSLVRSPARFLIAASFIVSFMVVVESVFADGSKPGLIRTTLMESPVELTSKSVNAKVIRVTFPSGFKTPWHTHEGPGPRYVVKGSLKVTEEGKVYTYNVGEVFWETGKLMAVENVGKGTAELIIFELAPVH